MVIIQFFWIGILFDILAGSVIFLTQLLEICWKVNLGRRYGCWGLQWWLNWVRKLFWPDLVGWWLGFVVLIRGRQEGLETRIQVYKRSTKLRLTGFDIWSLGGASQGGILKCSCCNLAKTTIYHWLIWFNILPRRLTFALQREFLPIIFLLASNKFLSVLQIKQRIINGYFIFDLVSFL